MSNISETTKRASSVPESAWRKMERALVARERWDRIRRGIITTVGNGEPRMMEKREDGESQPQGCDCWWPVINRYERTNNGGFARA